MQHLIGRTSRITVQEACTLASAVVEKIAQYQANRQDINNHRTSTITLVSATVEDGTVSLQWLKMAQYQAKGKNTHGHPGTLPGQIAGACRCCLAPAIWSS